MYDCQYDRYIILCCKYHYSAFWSVYDINKIGIIIILTTLYSVTHQFRFINLDPSDPILCHYICNSLMELLEKEGSYKGNLSQ